MRNPSLMAKRLVILLFFIAPYSLYGQSNCVQSLDNAKTLFAEGHLYDIPDVLKNCLKKGFTKEQKVQAYHLLSMTYLYLDRHEDAERAYMELLAIEPEFDVKNESDKIEIEYLDKKFITTPIFTFNARAGLNRTKPVVLQSTDSDLETYFGRTGFYFGPGIDFNINSKWKVGAELLYRHTAFYYERVMFKEQDILKMTQTQNMISLPVSVKYLHNTGGIQTYIYGGIMYDYLFFSNANLSSTDFSLDIEGGSVSNSDILDLTPTRKNLLVNLFGGIGAKYRIDYYYVFLELRFVGGLRNLVDKRYSPEENPYLYDLTSVFEHYYIDDDFRLNSFGFSVGFENPFYKPRKVGSGKSFFKRLLGK